MGQGAVSLADCKGRAFTPRWQAPTQGGISPKLSKALLCAFYRVSGRYAMA